MADIEKESLEAHVELCSERYKALHDKLDAVSERLDKQDKTLNHIANSITKQESNRNKQLIGWGAGIIASLTGAIAYLIIQQL
jgi:3-dehydroquinate synthetase